MYVATASQGKAGFPVIGTASTLLSGLVPGLLDKAFNAERDTYYDLTQFAQYASWESSTPAVTIEQVEITEAFGGEEFDPNLRNLLPGTMIDFDFQDTCAFDTPVSIIDWEYRVPVTNQVEPPPAGYWRTPLFSDSLKCGQLGQMDVTVTREDGGGMTEKILLSMTAWADWDGTIPVGWVEPLLTFVEF